MRCWRGRRGCAWPRGPRSRLLAAGAAAAAFLLLAAPSLAPSFDNPLLRRASDPQTIERTMGRRFASWEAGLKGFADRPVLGWRGGSAERAAEEQDHG